MPAHANREIHLASRPVGEPIPANFTLVESTVPAPGDGQGTVRNTFMSVDPYMRGRMNAGKSYAAPFQVGEVMSGGAVGEVVESRSPDLSLGDTVLHFNGWREYRTGAAGAVGSVAGQMAKLRGASRVIGSAGSDAKVRHLLDDLGFDAAFNYRNGPVRDQLHKAAPDGIDLYFDNVGGDHLEAAIGAMRSFGRIALCGAISQYNATSPPPGPRNLGLAIGRRLTLRGFI